MFNRQEIELLKKQIRTSGRLASSGSELYCEVQELASEIKSEIQARLVAQVFIKSLKYPVTANIELEDPKKWPCVQATKAIYILTKTLQYWLPYSANTELIKSNDAESFAKRFLALFTGSEPYIFLPNGYKDEFTGLNPGFVPNDFSNGIIVVSKNLVGFLFIGDQD